MELRARTVALYGRFSQGVRDLLAREIELRGGAVVRDLIHRADILVVGARADTLIDSGALPSRLATVVRAGKRFYSEGNFRNRLQSDATDAGPTYPLDNALRASAATLDEAILLAAFDLISLEKDLCAFGDVSTLKTAAGLRDSGLSPTQVVAAIRDSRQISPKGRYRLVVGGHGEPALDWSDGLTNLEGQRFLPFAESLETVEDLFEQAVMAEMLGRLDEAARLFDLCARADRTDAISLYNLANIHLQKSEWTLAAMTYRRALVRNSSLIEARYNLSHALEELGRIDEAVEQCREILLVDQKHPDATFNLAQLYIRQGKLFFAQQLFERYLTFDPPSEWSRKASLAIAYCARCLSIGDAGSRGPPG